MSSENPIVKTAALKQWETATTDIRVAFMNAPRRDLSRIVAMEIPQVFKKLGLADENEVWVVESATYR